MTEPTVRLQGAHKRFGAVQAVAGVDLEVHPGELVVLLGPSGCGKTTLLRCIAGLEQLDSGAVLFDGADLSSSEPQDRPVGLVFQDFALYPHKTVRENIALALRVRRWSRVDIDARVREVADLLRIGDLLERHPKQLSGGQKQRVGIGRALARRPRVLLMDEPLSNLDAQLRVEMRREITTLRDSLEGTAIVYVTHDQEEAMTLGDRLAVIDAGRIVQEGTARELYHDPTHLFVACFLGSPPVNIVPREGGGWTGARPEHIRLRSPEGQEVSLGTGVLLGVEDYGHTGVARYALGEREVCVRMDPEGEAPERVELAVAARHLLEFDRDERRLRAGRRHDGALGRDRGART